MVHGVSFMFASWLIVAKCLLRRESERKMAISFGTLNNNNPPPEQAGGARARATVPFIFSTLKALLDSPPFSSKCCSRLFGLEIDGDKRSHMVQVLCSFAAL